MDNNYIQFFDLSQVLIFLNKCDKIEGALCFASMLWMLWLKRNECLFNNCKATCEVNEIIIKNRAWSWSFVDLKDLWVVGPTELIQTHKKRELKLKLDVLFGYANFGGLNRWIMEDRKYKKDQRRGLTTY